MTVWHERTIEQRNLLNPAFCAIVVWHLVRGYQIESKSLGAISTLFPLELAFVGSSFVLRGQTRNQLPRMTSTSLATWIYDHPLERSAVAKGVVVLRDTVRDALLFGVQQGLLSVNGRGLDSTEAQAKKIKAYLSTSSDEVRECMRKAAFVGRWLCKAGAPPTVLALLGVQA